MRPLSAGSRESPRHVRAALTAPQRALEAPSPDPEKRYLYRMKETTEQYIKRILGYLEGTTPLAVLAAEPRRIADLVAGVKTERLAQRPAPGKWSVTEILAHLADVEMVQGFRIRLILGASGTAIQGFDQDAWASSSAYASQDPALSQEGYRVTRERTLRLLNGLSEEMWARHGVHSERGKETVRRVSEMLAGHDINHRKQIESILAG
jgi:hypothetical protein